MKDLLKRLEETTPGSSAPLSQRVSHAAANVKKRTDKAIVEASAAGAKAVMKSLEDSQFVKGLHGGRFSLFTLDRGDGTKIRVAIEDNLRGFILREEVQSNAPLSETVRAFHKKGLKGKLKTHQEQFWWYRALDWISDKQGRSGRPIGGGNMDITPKEAGELKRMGYIEIEDHQMGKRATLTSKGRKALNHAQDAFDEI